MSAKQNYAYALAPLMLDPPSLILASHYALKNAQKNALKQQDSSNPAQKKVDARPKHSTQTTQQVYSNTATPRWRSLCRVKPPWSVVLHCLRTHSIVSYLHEWRTTAMFELGTIGDALASYMSGSVWDFEAFLDCDRYSRAESCLFC